MTDTNTDTDVITGWVAIVACLAELGERVSVGTARRYTHRRDPIPVYWRLNRIVAHRSALREWVRRQTVHYSLAPVGAVKPHKRAPRVLT